MRGSQIMKTEVYGKISTPILTLVSVILLMILSAAHVTHAQVTNITGPAGSVWGAATNVGAVTWCGGASGCTGAVFPANSLSGTTLDPPQEWGRPSLR